MKRILCIVVAMSAATLAFGQGYDAQGFEPDTFGLGPLNGQDGWAAGLAGGGIEPMVVAAPDPVLDTQAVRLETTGTQGDQSWMEHTFTPADLLAEGYTNLVVSFDVYRPTTENEQNFWWYLFDAGTPTYGLQWDVGGTRPFGFPGAEAPTIAGRYANVTMEWDFVSMMAHSWYDGAAVDVDFAITDINSLTGWGMYLAHDADTNGISDQVFVDNFTAVATPEPATLTLLAIGLLLRRR